MTDAQKQEWLADTIEDLLSRGPSAPCYGTESWREHLQHMQKIETWVTKMYGAKIRTDRDPARMTLAGITATCTSGMSGLFSNWIRAARRKAAA